MSKLLVFGVTEAKKELNGATTRKDGSPAGEYVGAFFKSTDGGIFNQDTPLFMNFFQKLVGGKRIWHSPNFPATLKALEGKTIDGSIGTAVLNTPYQAEINGKMRTIRTRRYIVFAHQNPAVIEAEVQAEAAAIAKSQAPVEVIAEAPVANAEIPAGEVVA